MTEHEILKDLRIQFFAAVNRKDVHELGLIKDATLILGQKTELITLKKSCSAFYAQIQVMLKELEREIS